MAHIDFTHLAGLKTVSEKFDYLDSLDKGGKDGKIEKCIWDQYQKEYGCEGIDNFIRRPEAEATFAKYPNPLPDLELKSLDELAKSTTRIGDFEVKGNDEPMEELKAKEVVISLEDQKRMERTVVTPVRIPGGEAAIMAHKGRIGYPEEALDRYVQGRVIAEYYVDRDGSVCDVRITNSVDEALDNAVLESVKSLPRMIPAKNIHNSAIKSGPYRYDMAFRLVDKPEKEIRAINDAYCEFYDNLANKYANDGVIDENDFLPVDIEETEK